MVSRISHDTPHAARRIDNRHGEVLLRRDYNQDACDTFRAPWSPLIGQEPRRRLRLSYVYVLHLDTLDLRVSLAELTLDSIECTGSFLHGIFQQNAFGA